MNNDQTIPVPERLLKLAICHLEDGDWGSTAHELRKHLPAPQPRTVQDVVHLFEECAESERAAGDTHVGDVWQQAADMVWATLGGEPSPLGEPQPGEAWLVEWEGEEVEAIYYYCPIYANWIIAKREGYTTVESHEATPIARLTPDRSVEK